MRSLRRAKHLERKILVFVSKCFAQILRPYSILGLMGKDIADKDRGFEVSSPSHPFGEASYAGKGLGVRSVLELNSSPIPNPQTN
jgi:hypothetical protein